MRFLHNKWLWVGVLVLTIPMHFPQWFAGLPTPMRKTQLEWVINLNVGYAHLSRGMNMYTIDSLYSAVTPRDLPILAQLLNDPDLVKRMTTAEVLARLGPAGQAILRNSSSEEAQNVLHELAEAQKANK